MCRLIYTVFLKFSLVLRNVHEILYLQTDRQTENIFPIFLSNFKLNSLSGKMVLTFHAANSRTLPNMDIKVRMARKMSLGSWTWDMEIPCVLKLDLGKLLGCEKQCVSEKCSQGSSFEKLISFRTFFRIHVYMNSVLSFPQHVWRHLSADAGRTGPGGRSAYTEEAPGGSCGSRSSFTVRDTVVSIYKVILIVT